MKALIYEKYGGSEVLNLSEVSKPVPKEYEVLVEVHAVSINDYDWGIIQGDPFITRIDNGLFRPKKVLILGSDIAGIVVDVGTKVTRFKSGDAVYGDLTGKWGGFAEYVCAHENTLTPKPEKMSFVQAAGIPQAAGLAVQGLIQYGGIKDHQSILINGAAGGVGTYGLQIAKTFYAKVTGVDCTEKLDFMQELGFDSLVDFKKTDFTKMGLKYDMILDNKTQHSPFRYLKSLNPGGTYVTTGGKMRHLFSAFVMGKLIQLITGKSIKVVVLRPNYALSYMNDLYEKGLVQSIIHGPFSFDQALEAMKIYELNQHKGKVVIQIKES